MLDNLRDQASSSPLFQPEEEPPEKSPKKPKVRSPRRSFDRTIGMNAQQRFLLVFMLFVFVAILGSALLLVTGKVVPPFLTAP
jgi:Trk-type K+ transport system membrane component